DLLELCRSLRLLVDVRVPALGESPVGLLDVGVGGGSPDAEGLVVVADGHRWRSLRSIRPALRSRRAYDAGMPDLHRLTVALTFDHDSLSDGIRRGDSPIKMSHAEFGHNVGVPRILELLAREGVRSSWFIPGATLELYPGDTERILAGGHEVGCHGWFHEDYSALSEAEQQDIQQRSIEAVNRFTGARPRGHRAPYWAFSEATIGVLEDAGFVYDSSLMADDYRPYRVRRGDRHSTTEGSTFGPESSLLEVPVYWTLDDWPLFEPGDNGRDGMRPPSQ